MSAIFLFGAKSYAAPKEADFKLNINNYDVELTTPLLVENSRTLAPLRLIAEELGYEVVWQESTRTVDVIDNSEKIVFTIDSNVISVNGNSKEIDVSARIFGDRTYIPLRALENLNSEVEWIENTRTVVVNRAAVGLVGINPAPVIEKPAEKVASNNRSTFEYWDYYNNYSTSIIMDYPQIQNFNTANLNSANKMKNISALGEYTDGTFLISELNRVAKFSVKRYDSSRKAHTAEYKANLVNNMNIPTDPNFSVKIGVINKRTMMRTYPTNEPFYKSRSSNLDMAVETAIYPWEEIAIYHTSANGKWLYGEIFNSYGWVPVENVSFAPREEIRSYTNSLDFAVITTDKITINGIQLDMGTRVPLISENSDSFTILLPNDSTALTTTQAQISKSAANRGYLPFTQTNIIKQAIKFYGEVYGWGGLKNTRDCSGLIQDVYRSFGILIPRNSGDQGNSVMGMTKSVKGMSTADRLKALTEYGPGASLHMTGHVMMYMGVDEKGTHSIIHQYIGHYVGSKYVAVNKCDITSVNILGENKNTYLTNCYGLKYFK